MVKLNLWASFPEKEKKEYIKFLKIFGALSGLFKDIENGSNANRPYLYYRNHEQLFARVFEVEDLTRHDSAFDAIAVINGVRIGIGLKTWVHLRDKTYQKVAEFNKLASTIIQPLVEAGDTLELVKKIASLRNERILLDQRAYGTDHAVYHNITRDCNVMNIVESSYDLVDIESIKVEKKQKRKGVFDFKDKNHKYKFYLSKSVLLQEFDASSDVLIEKIPIKLFEDPFELLAQIKMEKKLLVDKKNRDFIYLPMYSDRDGVVQERSALNAWNGPPKNPKKPKPRPKNETYIPIPAWVHRKYPYFFGFDADNREERGASSKFLLHLPDGRALKAIVTQDGGKSLQTDPQGALGEWILRDVLKLEYGEVLTMDKLRILGIDSFRIIKIGTGEFKIDLAETNSFEEWKLDHQG